MLCYKSCGNQWSPTSLSILYSYYLKFQICFLLAQSAILSTISRLWKSLRPTDLGKYSCLFSGFFGCQHKMETQAVQQTKNFQLLFSRCIFIQVSVPSRSEAITLKAEDNENLWTQKQLENKAEAPPLSWRHSGHWAGSPWLLGRLAASNRPSTTAVMVSGTIKFIQILLWRKAFAQQDI